MSLTTETTAFTTATTMTSSTLGAQVTVEENLPATTVQCHASNLLRLPDGTLLCAWFGGTQEGTSDISIYLTRQEPGSASWSKPVRVSSDPGRSEQNPVLFRDPATGRLWLFHTAQPVGNQDQCEIIARTSEDGHSWTEPFSPFPNKRGILVRQPVIVQPDGTWLLPVFYCRAPPGFRWNGNDDASAVMYTRDSGKTWKEREVPGSLGLVHMNIIPLHPIKGEYVALFRSRWADNIYVSTSQDGLSWVEPTKTTLPNPNSGICAAALPNGSIVVVFNNSSATPGMPRRKGLYDDITPEDDKRPDQAEVDGKSAIWGTPRKALSVGISKDSGKTWQYKLLEDGDGACMTNNSAEKTNREISYPSILVGGDNGPNSVDIAFTFHRQCIKHVQIADVEEFVKS